MIDARALAGLDPAALVDDLHGETMGTSWRVRFASPLGTDLAALRGMIQSRLDDLVAQMSHWDAASLLSEFSCSAAGSWTSLPHDFAAVMEAGLALAERTAGAFDPTMGRLTDLHGLGPNPRDGDPSPRASADAMAASGWQRLAYDREARRLRQPGGLWLDLSGIAKGYAVDALADLLGDRGIMHCLVEIGGECAGRGMRPDGDPWWVALETPPDLRTMPLSVALHQISVATSGDYVRGAHTLDPRNGRPVANGVASVSVIHQSTMLADAWATALTVLGREAGAALAIAEGVATRIVSRDGAMTREWISPALDAMMAD